MAAPKHSSHKANDPRYRQAVKKHATPPSGGKSAPGQLEIEELVGLFNAGRYAEGEMLAHALTRRFPEHGFGWKALGTMLSAQGRSSEALPALQKTVRLMPNDPQAHSNLGTVLSSLDRYEEAADCQRRALVIKPDFVEAHCNLAVALQHQGRASEAMVALQKAALLRPDDVQILFKLSHAQTLAGHDDEAAKLLLQVVASAPDFAEAHNNLGVILIGRGDLTAARVCFDRALALNPGYVDAHCNLGNVLLAQRRLPEAEACYRQAIACDPRCAEAHNNLGNVLKDQSRYAEAEAAYRDALDLAPDYVDAFNNLGIVFKRQGKREEADRCFAKAVDLRPDFAEAHYNFGISLNEQDRYAEAEEHYRSALAAKPDYAEALNNFGNNLEAQLRHVEAEAAHRRAIALKPGYADAHCNLGNSLRGQGRLAEAEASYRHALELRPEFPEALYNLGIALAEQFKFSESEAGYRHALELRPDYADAQTKLANILREQGRYDEAYASYRRALELKPDSTEARSNLLFDLNYTAAQTPQRCLEEAGEFGRVVSRAATIPFASWRCDLNPSRLCVGLVSGDLRTHPVGFFLEALLSQIDRERIELRAYAADVDEDEVSERLRAHLSAWTSLRKVNDAEAAKLIHDDAVHVLLDLSGHTARNRLPMMAWRPAPVQATWLGYFATTGVAAIDYLIGDPYVTPCEEEAHFTESIWRLPETYLCFTPPDLSLSVASLPALANGFVTFGCFNNLSKMTDAVVALWSQVLHAVPNSKLFLKTRQLNDKNSLAKTVARFAAHGIANERLILEGGSPRAELLASYHRVDIALDPFPYPGGTTSVESLWMGVPVVARRGDRFLSHVGESVAHNSGMGDWIAADDADYVRKACEFASNLQNLSALRLRLRAQVLAAPIFNARRFARHFEDALWGMWSRHAEFASNAVKFGASR